MTQDEIIQIAGEVEKIFRPLKEALDRVELQMGAMEQRLIAEIRDVKDRLTKIEGKQQ